MSLARRALSALSKVGIIIAIAVAFLFGLAGTVYLSLRSPEVKVPKVEELERSAGEAVLSNAGLNMRVARTRPVTDKKPDMILRQWPGVGEVIKVGQTVAVEISRTAKEGENATSSADTRAVENKNESQSQNANESSAATNVNNNSNKNKRNKNAANKNSNNGDNTNNRNAVNRNANNQNANNRNTVNRNANSNLNRNLPNVNRSVPLQTAPTLRPGARVP